MSRIFLEISCLFLISILSITVHAADLQAFIQDGEITDAPEKVTTVSNTNAITNNPLKNTQTADTNEQFTHIIELVVAGIVASALIISVLVLFLGRWAGRREKKIIKKIRIKAEEEQENIIAAATTVREQEKETTKIVHFIRDEAKEFSAKKEVIKSFDKDVHEITLQAKAKKEVIDDISDTVTENVGKIKSYWDEQLSSTINSIYKVQTGLDRSLSTVDKNLDEMLQQKVQSDELLSAFISKNDEQLNVINQNSISSDELNKNLTETLKESTQLLRLLKKHQKSAEKSLKKFTEELITYEEQAYEQFDTSFQVADLARQELNANIDESRKHIETMRRHEEQSHSINTQTQKNLKSLDFTKITKLSHTLDSTFSMFTTMTDKVDETRAMLDELNDLNTDISINKKSDVDNTTLSTKPSQKPQLAKKVDVKPETTPSSQQSPSPLKVDLNKPVIKVNSGPLKTEVTQESVKAEIKIGKKIAPAKEATVKDIITTTKGQTDIIKPAVNKEIVADKKPLARKKPLYKKSPAIEQAISKKPLTEKKPFAEKNPITKKQTLKEQATTVKQPKVEPTIGSKNNSAPAKLKPIVMKSKGTAKPIKDMTSKASPTTKAKEDSIANAIEEQVEIKSVLSSSEASKTAFKIANADNMPVSFFTNVKKNKTVKKDEKKEPIFGSVKRTFFGNK